MGQRQWFPEMSRLQSQTYRISLMEGFFVFWGVQLERVEQMNIEQDVYFQGNAYFLTVTYLNKTTSPTIVFGTLFSLVNDCRLRAKRWRSWWSPRTWLSIKPPTSSPWPPFSCYVESLLNSAGFVKNQTDNNNSVETLRRRPRSSLLDPFFKGSMHEIWSGLYAI